MSAHSDLRDNLERIADLAPLTERERELALMQFGFLEDACQDIEADPDWYGDKAVSAYRLLFADDPTDIIDDGEIRAVLESEDTDV